MTKEEYETPVVEGGHNGNHPYYYLTQDEMIDIIRMNDNEANKTHAVVESLEDMGKAEAASLYARANARWRKRARKWQKAYCERFGSEAPLM